MNLLVTGGMGFIGSNFIELIASNPEVSQIVNIDCPSRLSAAANRLNCKEFTCNPKYAFYDIWLEHLSHPTSENLFQKILTKHQITHIIHFAAESHVDNSISNPTQFIQSNIIGTYNLLEICRKNPQIRFHHVSTDEVYGSLGEVGKFTETSPYAPNSPYSASKASSDMLVRAYFHTYKLPVTISNCSNNFGPKQHNEKFIPVVINSLLNNKKIPVYGTGKNIRDWIYVKDHCEAVWEIAKRGKLGETYNVGGDCEKTNLEIIQHICKELNMDPSDVIEFVEDRKGHDFRYAIDNTKIQKELKWRPNTDFNVGLQLTIQYYKKNEHA
jgi:dTDP-glucose 4,6-dehydratase